MKTLHSTRFEGGPGLSSGTATVSFSAENALEIMGLKLQPDRSKAYLEIHLAHAFPVRTIDNTALHPQVVANSYRSMLHQVFDLGHSIKQYNPDEFGRDRIIGAIVAVEFPPTPMAGWSVRYSGSLSTAKAEPPGIRAAAVVFKNAESVARILGEHQTGRRTWTVSMENQYYLEMSGFLVENADGQCTGDETPDEFAELGLAYYPALSAPESLLECFDVEQSKVTGRWDPTDSKRSGIKTGKSRGREVIALLGGLKGSVHFQGVGITPMGKEKEAEISQVLASAAAGESEPFGPLEELLRAMTVSGQ